MASKRVRNRIYWAVAKAIAHNVQPITPHIKLWHKALGGRPDSELTCDLYALEDQVGGVNHHRDLNDPSLREARRKLDEIREAWQDGTPT